MAEIDLDRVPRTLDEAVEMLFVAVPDDVKQQIKESNDSTFAIVQHHNLGRWCRNNWSLWDREMPLARWFIDTYRLGHADDTSGLIFHCLVRRIQERDPEIAREVERYHRHWAQYGVDPVTCQQLPVT